MSARLSPHGLLYFLGKPFLGEAETQGFLKERDGPRAFPVFHARPFPVNPYDFQVWKGDLHIHFHAVYIVFKDSARTQGMGIFSVNTDNFVSAKC